MNSTFTDQLSNKQFRYIDYFGRQVLQDVSTGLINAGKYVQEIAKERQKDIKFNHFTRSQYWNDLALELNEDKPYTTIYSTGYGSNVAGTYVPMQIFHLVAFWADKYHKHYKRLPAPQAAEAAWRYPPL